MCMQVFTGMWLPWTGEKVWLTCSWAAWSAIALVSCRNRAFATLPRAAKHLWKTKAVSHWGVCQHLWFKTTKSEPQQQSHAVEGVEMGSLTSIERFCQGPCSDVPSSPGLWRSHGHGFNRLRFRDRCAEFVPVYQVPETLLLHWLELLPAKVYATKWHSPDSSTVITV